MQWKKSEVFALINTVVSVLGFGAVIVQLYLATGQLEQSQKHKRAELLTQLHERAFGPGRMGEVFQKIEYGTLQDQYPQEEDPSEEETFSHRSFHGSPDQKALIELLKFIDLLHDLREMELLQEEDVKTFQYFIHRVNDNKFVAKYKDYLRQERGLVLEAPEVETPAALKGREADGP